MITIIDYNLGNSKSIQNMFRKIGVESVISNGLDDIRKSKGLILPGVGAFDKGMANLKDLDLLQVINDEVLIKKKPILGICLGMQLMTLGSEEGVVEGLGWINARTIRFKFNDKNFKVPHMGWSEIETSKTSSLFSNFIDPPRFYHVHSFHVVCNTNQDVAATAEYGFKFTTSFCKENIYGVQFHPEKSHKFGMQLLKNFSDIV